MTKTKCASCGRYFTGLAEFDAHRVGPFGHRPSRRRCLTDDEMSPPDWAAVPTCITNETGRPMREVYFRPARRPTASVSPALQVGNAIVGTGAG